MRTRMLGHLRYMVFIMSIVFIRSIAPADAATVNFSDLFPGGSLTSITSLDGSLRFDQFAGDNTFSDTITQINAGLIFFQQTPTMDTSDIGPAQGGFSYHVTVLTPPQALLGFQQTVTGFQTFGSNPITIQSTLEDPISISSIGVSSVSVTLPSQNGVPISGSIALTGSRVQAIHSLLYTGNASSDSLGAASSGAIAHIYGITPVPLPPAVILFGAGLVALVGLGARSWRQRKGGLA